MASTIRPLLPPLNNAHKIQSIEKTGVWQVLGASDLLEVIARGLNTGQTVPGSAGDIVSVPDVWAQLTTFHNALTVQRHPLHARAVGEWRGLLAAFALAAYQSEPVTCELIKLSALGTGRWAQIVGRLPPPATLLGNTRLDEVGLVRAGPRLVAIAQSLTLLAPSRSLPDHDDAKTVVPWMQRGRFIDPLLAGDRSPQERAVLANMLTRLCADLEAEQHLDGDMPILLGLARAYNQDVLKQGSIPATTFEQEPVQLQLPAGRAFAALRRREVVGRSDQPASDCLLAFRQGLSSALKGIVLVDLELDHQLGRAASNIHVWGRHSLQAVQARPDLLDTIRAEAQRDGILVVTPDDLFLPTLYRAEGLEDGEGLKRHPPNARNHLLPFTPLVLALMSGAALTRACRVAGAGEGLAFDLQLPLQAGGSVTLSRHYPSEEWGEPPPSFSVWPDFQAPWWRLHLAYSGATTDIQLVTGALVSLEGLTQVLDADDGFTAVQNARGLAEGATARLNGATWFNTRDTTRSLFEIPGAPEAALLEDRRKGVAKPAGIVLLPEPKPVQPGSAALAATVGIDFGTTNTAAYLQIGSQEPIAMRIEPRHLLPYGLVLQSKDELDRELLPVDPIDIPFQTILRDRLLTPDGHRRPFRDTLIYFAQRRGDAISSAGNNQEPLFADLKWSSDQQTNERVELFLTQLVILGFAEAGMRGIEPRQVAFRFSFPEAFRPRQLDAFKGAADNAVRRGRELAGGPPPAGTAPPASGFQTESVATARYFIHRLGTSATEGLATFDIGGQTTDVAVIQRRSLGAEQLAWRGSFQLAGRHMLIDHLRENRGVLADLANRQPDLKDLLDRLKDKGSTSRDASTLAIELLVNSQAFAEASRNILPTLGGTANAEWLRAVALSGLAGLFDYVGRAVRQLASAGTIELRARTPFSVCLGGRASLLFKALLRSDEDQQAMLRFFTAAAGADEMQARLVFSEHPKLEVAYGLVGDDLLLTRAAGSEPPLGEAVRSGDAAVTADSRVSALDLTKVWRIEAADEFNRFTQRLPELRFRPVLSERDMGLIVGSANEDIVRSLQTALRERVTGDKPSDLADARSSTSDSSAIEPPFIILLRHFVHRLATDKNAIK